MGFDAILAHADGGGQWSRRRWGPRPLLVFTRQRAMTRLFLTLPTCAALCAVAVLIAHGPAKLSAAQAQGSPAPLSFEVASVRRAPPVGAGGPVSIRIAGLQGNRWSADGVTLLML